MRVGRLRNMGRSFCCTRKYRKGRKWREAEGEGRNLLNTDITVRLSDKITLHCVGKYVEIDLYDYTISDNIIIPAEYIPLGRPVTEIAVIHEGPDRLTTGRMLINGINFVFYNSNWTNITHEQGYYVRGSVSYIRASGI